MTTHTSESTGEQPAVDDPPAVTPAAPATAAARWTALAFRKVGGVALAGWAALAASLVFGFWTFWKYQPFYIYDSRYYIAMALRNGGTPVQVAVHTAAETINFPFESWYFSHDDMSWDLVKPRVLYPFLSTPFVKVFGIHVGMLVVPTVSIIAFVYLMTRLLTRLYGQGIAVPTVLVFTFSMTLFRWQATAMTEGLTLALMAMLVYNLPLGRRSRPRDVVLIGSAVVLLAITRQLGPVPGAMVGAPWLWTAIRQRKIRNEWFPAFAVTAALTLVITETLNIVAPYDLGKIFQNTTGETSMAGAIADFPDKAWKILVSEGLSMMDSDRIMLLFVFAALVFAVVGFTRVQSAMFIGCGLATLVLCVGIGVPAQMRYEVTLYPAMLVSVGGLVSEFAKRASGRAEQIADWSRGRALPAVPRTRDRVALPLGAGVAGFLALTIGWSATHGARSLPSAPPGPAAAASLETYGYNSSHPVKPYPAEVGVQEAIDRFEDYYFHRGGFAWILDQRHIFAYHPREKTCPTASTCQPDGNATIIWNDASEAQVWHFTANETLDGKLDSRTLQVTHRVVSKSGEDLDIRVREYDGGPWHEGHAVVLYGSRFHTKGLVTELIWRS